MIPRKCKDLFFFGARGSDPLISDTSQMSSAEGAAHKLTEFMNTVTVQPSALLQIMFKLREQAGWG